VIRDEPPLEVFWVSGSPYGWRVLLALAIKGAPFQSRRLSAADGDHKKPEFLAINPRGKLPALRHGDLSLSESVAIVRYIDRLFPRPPLFGDDASGEARINRQIDEIENYLVPNTGWVTRAVFGDVVAGREEMLNTRAGRARYELRGLDERVGDWLVDGRLSAADVILYPVIAALLRAAAKPAAAALDLQLLPFEARYPRLAEWCARVEALPGYDEAYPPHWRD